MENAANTMTTDFFNCGVAFALNEFISFKTNITRHQTRTQHLDTKIPSLTSRLDQIFHFISDLANDVHL
ncbi:hypothetical protein D3C72_2338530 [compost metagenome]